GCEGAAFGDGPPALPQQRACVYAGATAAALDAACVIAAYTLMPAGSDILTVEFKTNLLAPASGTRFIFRAEVIRPGRTLTISEARAYALRDGAEHLIATMTGTLMAMARREGASVAARAWSPA